MCREIVKRIDMWGIDMLFVVGGNGGNAGAAAIQAQCEKDAVVCNVVGVPKSIDNDILVVGMTTFASCCYQHPCWLSSSMQPCMSPPVALACRCTEAPVAEHPCNI